MKRKLAMLLAVLCLTALAAGCGASSNEAGGGAAPSEWRSTGYGDGMMGMDSDMEYEESARAESRLLPEKPGGDGSKLIYTAEMNLETTAFDEAEKNLSALVAELGGWMQSSSVHYGGSGYRYGQYSVRIPQEKFHAFLTRTGELAHVVYTSSNVQDISEVYYDTASRLETQKTKLERLQALLAKAENMEDIITLESAISDTEWTIENLSGEIKRYDSQVDDSTVNFSLDEVYQLSNVEQPATGFFSRVGTALASGARGFADFVQELVVMLAYAWVWVALAAVIVVAVLYARRKRRARLELERKPQPEKRDDKTE